jgi:SSS family solute:Na+ symporter
MHGIVAADRFYFVLMYTTFAFLVVWLVTHYGGLDFLRQRVPPECFTWNGGRPAQAVLVWYVIALATLVEPAFYESCFSARDERTARAGILISIGSWAIFDCMTTTTGLYARALLPELDDPSRAFPLLGEAVLPPLARGVFFAGMLAVIMSTLDSYLFISAQTLGRDIAWRWRWKGSQESGEVVRWVRISLGVTSLLAIAIAVSGLGVIELWHHLGSIGTPALLVPVLASFSARTRLSPRAAAPCIALAAGVAAIWLAAASGGRYWLGLEPIFPALAVSLAVWGADLALRRRR